MDPVRGTDRRWLVGWGGMAAAVPLLGTEVGHASTARAAASADPTTAGQHVHTTAAAGWAS